MYIYVYIHDTHTHTHTHAYIHAYTCTPQAQESQWRSLYDNKRANLVQSSQGTSHVPLDHDHATQRSTTAKQRATTAKQQRTHNDDQRECDGREIGRKNETLEEREVRRKVFFAFVLSDCLSSCLSEVEFVYVCLCLSIRLWCLSVVLPVCLTAECTCL